MKWTFISLAAGGALTYGLIFLVHATRDAPQGAADNSSSIVLENVAQAAEIDEHETLATFTEAEVSNTAEVAPAPQPAPAPRWSGDPWPAGVSAYQEADYELAVEALEVAVGEKEESPYRHYLLGLSYLKNGEPQGAVEELERSLELAPGDVRALVNLGRAHLADEAPDAARAAIDAALELAIDDADAWNVLGRVELTEGNLEAAEASFQKTVALDAEHAYAWNNLGYVRILQERFEEAVEPLQKATQSDVTQPYFYNNLGVALERTDDLAGAADAFAQARDLGHPVAEVSLARVETVALARGDSTEVFGPQELIDEEMAVAAGEVETPVEIVGEN
jgi:Flp pilus assembly protein TadD